MKARSPGRLFALSVCLWVSVLSALQAREIPFNPPAIIGNLTGTSDVFYSTADAGDIDGDGDQDFVISDRGDGNTLYWYENDGSGSTWTARLIADNGFSNLEKLQLTDLDGDGDLDVLTADSAMNALYWFENGGTSWSQHTIDMTATDLNNVAEARAADLDNDGDLDVVAVSPNSGKVLVYTNTAGDASNWSQTFNKSVINPHALDLGDWDMDGGVDILVGAGANGNLFQIYYNSTASKITFGSSTGNVYAIRMVDMGGDGAPEILTASSGTGGGISVWFGAGPGTWTETVVVTGIGEKQLEVLDMDHDGDLDIVASNNGGKVAWYENTDGQGTSWSERILTSTGGNSEAALPLDADNDGDIDLVATRQDTGDIALFRNDDIHYNTALLRQPDVDYLFANPKEVVIFDADGDGNDDIVALNRRSNGVRINWYTGNGDGSFDSAQTLLDLPQDSDFNGLALRKGDLDKDGDIDLAFATSGNNAIYTLMNPYNQGPYQPAEKGSTVWKLETIATGMGNLFDIQLADLDGDSRLDLIAIDRAAGTLEWFANDGVWTQRTVTLTAGGSNLSTNDLDGDGTVDLVVHTVNSNTLEILQNTNGNGSNFATSSMVLPYAAYRTQIADMDQDGDNDIAVAGNNTTSFWLANNGAAGQWTLYDTGVSPGSHPTSFHIVDMDQDGDQDWVIAAYGSQLIKWLENMDGTATSWSEHTVLTGITLVDKVALADVDHNGQIDWVFNSYAELLVGIALNGGGQFRLSTTGAPEQNPEDGMVTRVLTIQAIHLGKGNDADIELSRIRLRFTGQPPCPTGPMAEAVVNSLVKSIHLYRDDGDGDLDLLNDTLVTTAVGPYSLSNGEYSLVLPDQSPEVRLSRGQQAGYFVAMEYHNDASAQSCNSFQVTHLTSPDEANTSRAEHRSSGLPLHMEYAMNVSSGTISLVAGSNAAPTSSGVPDFSVDEDAAVSMDLSGYFSDPDGDTLTFTATGLPASLSLSAEGTLSGTPTNEDSLQPPFSVTVTATDPQGASVDDTFTLTVNPVNDAPVFTGTIPDQNATLGMAFSLDVSGYFSDPDLDTLSYSLSGAPAVLSINASGIISGTPDLSSVSNSPFSITVTATDPSGLSVSSNTFQWEATGPSDLAFSDSFE